MRRIRHLLILLTALGLLAAACVQDEPTQQARVMRDFDGNIVTIDDFANRPNDVPVEQVANDNATEEIAIDEIDNDLPVEQADGVPSSIALASTTLGTAPDIGNDLADNGCRFVSEELITEIINPPAGVHLGLLGIGRFGSCTYLNTVEIENTVHVDVAPLRRGSFFDAQFKMSYHIQGDPITGHTREASEEPYGDQSYLFLSPSLGPEISVNIDNAFVTVRVDTLDDNSDESEQIENVREIIEHILMVNEGP